MAAIAQATLQTSITRQRRGYDYWAPTAKVSAGVLAGAATILITAFLGPHWKSWTQQDMTPAIVTAITTIVTFAIQYWIPDRRK
jgi:putative flippase GtrA